MPDILVPRVPAAVVAQLDARAALLGISRSEYVRRELIRDTQRADLTVTVGDLQKSGALLSGLLDSDLIERAWH